MLLSIRPTQAVKLIVSGRRITVCQNGQQLVFLIFYEDLNSLIYVPNSSMDLIVHSLPTMLS